MMRLDNFVLLGAWYGWLIPVGLVLLGAVGAAALLLAVYFGLGLAFPKVAAIARTTALETILQPLFWVEIAGGVFLLALSVLLPYNTFGDDIKDVKEMGLTLIMLLSVVLAVWTASVSIADEVEGRTALTLLSKPISRRHFILGKFLGVLGPVFCMFIVLGAFFLSSVSYKVKFEARELAKSEPTAQECQEEMVQIVPGLVLSFFESTVLAAISVAISTRLPMLPNLLISSSIYVLGNLAPLVVGSRMAAEHPLVGFVGRFLATILPVLDHFNIQAAVATGRTIPLAYVGWAGLYCLLYSSVAMLLALLMFEDRDLA